jgi:hypothetical protein
MNTRTHAFSENRDAVYALLNICDPIDIVPDYTKAAPQLYTEAITATIRQDKHLNILCNTITDPTRFDQSLDVSSWVPHLESGITEGSLYNCLWSFGKKKYNRVSLCLSRTTTSLQVI